MNFLLKILFIVGLLSSIECQFGGLEIFKDLQNIVENFDQKQLELIEIRFEIMAREAILEAIFGSGLQLMAQAQLKGDKDKQEEFTDNFNILCKELFENFIDIKISKEQSYSEYIYKQIKQSKKIIVPENIKKFETIQDALANKQQRKLAEAVVTISKLILEYYEQFAPGYVANSKKESIQNLEALNKHLIQAEEISKKVFANYYKFDQKVLDQLQAQDVENPLEKLISDLITDNKLRNTFNTELKKAGSIEKLFQNIVTDDQIFKNIFQHRLDYLDEAQNVYQEEVEVIIDKIDDNIQNSNKDEQTNPEKEGSGVFKYIVIFMAAIVVLIFGYRYYKRKQALSENSERYELRDTQ